MKTLILTGLFLFLNFYIGVNGQKTVSVSEIISGAKETNANIISIYDLDVINYFELWDIYDTDLKKEVFKKTPEYTEKLNELKIIRDELLQSELFIAVGGLFDGVNYDINKKGFDLQLRQNWGTGTAEAIPPKSIKITHDYLDEIYIYLKPIPTKQIPFKYLGEGCFTENLFIPLNEENALEIENNSEDVVVLFLFKINGKEQVKFRYKCLHYGWYNMDSKHLKADTVRLLVVNVGTGNLYLDKTYTYQPNTK